MLKSEIASRAAFVSAVVGLVYLTSLNVGVHASNPDGSVTLTPSKLYLLIETEQKKSKHQTAILKLHAERISKLEARIEALEKKLQATRDQTANIAMKLRKQIRAVWN